MQTQDNAHVHIVLVKGRVQKGEHFLMAQRSMQELHKPGVWSLPGGKVDDEIQRDILQHTLKKEIREEVGLEITDHIQLVYNNSFIRSDDSHVVGLTFLCQRQAGEAQALEDTAQVRRFTLDELLTFSEAEPFLQIEIQALVDFLKK